jgi:hypothetical protein
LAAIAAAAASAFTIVAGGSARSPSCYSVDREERGQKLDRQVTALKVICCAK